MSRNTFLFPMALALLTCCWLAGCGGGSGIFGGADTGAVQFTIQWPAGPMTTGQASPALVPEAVRSITVVLTMNGQQVAAPQTVTRPANGPQTAQVLFENVPVGAVTATATAYPNPDGTGTPLAQGAVVVQVQAGQTTTTSLTMDSTIVSLVIEPRSLYCPIGDSYLLAVSGRDAAGRVVLVTLSKLQWNYNTSVVSVNATGNCTGLAGGYADVTATDTESGRSGTAEVYVGPSPEQGTVYGQVRASGGQPINGATVAACNDPELRTVVTGPDGRYVLAGVSPGAHAIAASAAGRRTVNGIVVMGAAAVRYDAELPPFAPSPLNPPTIFMNTPVVNTEQGLATISGTITNMDSDTAVLMFEGEQSLVSVSAGQFSHVLVLHPGLNTFAVWATNAAGTGFGPPQEIYWTGPGAGNYYFRVTLTWDTGAPVNQTDLDLHVWSPSGQHCFYGNKVITAGSLDVDNTSGFGPENFTCDALQAGVFRVAVNYYSGWTPPTHAVIRITLGTLSPPPPPAQAPPLSPYGPYGPYELTVPNGNTGYPVTGNTASWWRPCDITLGSDGEVTVTEPDTGVELTGVANVGTAQKQPRK